MKTTAVTLEDLQGVFAVPPLCRRASASRPLDLAENDRLVRHMSEGGLSRFLYGGNAFLYHLTLAEYAQLLDWMSGIDGWAIPSLGPSFGRAMDQAPLLRRYGFPCAMALPCGDPRDAAGLEAGLREIAAAAGMSLILYLKSEDGFGSNPAAGLDAVARLVADGTCVAIKYAVVRKDPAVDPYLDALLERVDRRRVVSGIGERPAIAHMKGFRLPGFTTGSGCLVPALTSALFAACARADWSAAEPLRAQFLPLEDRRDEWGPARVLHAAAELAGVAKTGPIPPFVTALAAAERAEFEPVALELLRLDSEKRAALVRSRSPTP
jgi:dihydrodipicolinate synthase/N-acetylneuraminate lyase